MLDNFTIEPSAYGAQLGIGGTQWQLVNKVDASERYLCHGCRK